MANESVLQASPADYSPLHDLVFHRVAYPTVVLAQEFGLFQMVADSPASLPEIGERLKLAPRSAEAMVAVTSALGFLKYDGKGRYGLSELGSTYLLTSSPYYCGALLKLPEMRWSEEHQINQLRGTFRMGSEPGQPLAVVIDQLPQEEIRGFIGLMHTITLPAVGGLARQEVFGRVRNLLDVGGGSGSLSLGIASNHPEIRSTIMDLAPVCAIARENIAAYQLEDRITTLSSDMFNDPWPAGHDAILFGNIFHDWGLDACRQLARKAFDALEPGGSILLHEVPLNENRDGPLFAACFSVLMLLHERGKQYTLSEFREIFSEAGFTDFQAVPTFSYYHLISARKP
jgi:hypothetical protein